MVTLVPYLDHTIIEVDESSSTNLLGQLFIGQLSVSEVGRSSAGQVLLARPALRRSRRLVAATAASSRRSRLHSIIIVRIVWCADAVIQRESNAAAEPLHAWNCTRLNWYFYQWCAVNLPINKTINQSIIILYNQSINLIWKTRLFTHKVPSRGNKTL